MPAGDILQRGRAVVALGRATIAICLKKSWQCDGQYRPSARRLVRCIESERLPEQEGIIPGEICIGGVVLIVRTIVDGAGDGEFGIGAGSLMLLVDDHVSRWLKIDV